MTIWLLAFLLLSAVGSSGLQQGALRMLITFFGAIVATFLAVPLSPHISPLIAMIGFENPLWVVVLPPLIVFVAISLVVTSIAQVVHLKISVLFKYRRKEAEYFRWERMNSRVGIPIGLLTAMLYLIFIGALVNATGYLTAQVESKGENPVWLKLVNRMRADIHSTGLVRFSAAMNPLPPSFFDAADLIGLVYHNPELISRALDYPALMQLADNKEVQGLLADPQFIQASTNQVSIVEIMALPKVQGILTNAETMGQLRAQFEPVDTKDLHEFLKTGKSPKFDPELILGRWQIDAAGTISSYRKLNGSATIAELGRLKAYVVRRLPDLTLAATPDNRLVLKGTQPNIPAYAPIITSKGIIPAIAAPGTPKAQPKVAVQGTWARAGDKYQVKFQGDKGERSGDATVENGKLVIVFNKDPLVFERE